MNADNLQSNQPNELDNQPKVSNDPATRLPEATKGQIQNILQDSPEVEAIRRINHKQALRGNTHNLRSGKYSKLLPQYLLNHLAYIDELTFVGVDDIRNTVIRLLKTNLKRVALAEYREAEGQSIDPHLSKLVRDSFIMAHAIYQTPAMLTKGSENEFDYLKGLDKEQIEIVDQFVTSLNTLLYGSNEEEPDTIAVLPS